MKQKPHPLIISCLTVLLFIGFPSCDGPDYAAIRGIEHVSVYDPLNRIYINEGDTLTSDTMMLFVSPILENFAQAVTGTMTSAWALSPPDPWMANELVDIRIFCDKPIYGLQPGENLASILHFGDSTFPFSLSEYLDIIPKKGDEANFWNFPISVFWPSKPVPDNYTFTVELEDNNGHVFTSSSPVFAWQ